MTRLPDIATDLDIANLAKLCHEALILATLGGGPLHGYQLALDIAEGSSGRFTFQHGTLYPILHRLEGEGLIEGIWSEGTGRRRKQYSLTPAGRRRSGQLTGAWTAFTSSLLNALERNSQ